MSNEIGIPGLTSGLTTVYAMVYNSVNQVAQTTTSTWVTWNSANRANYDFPLTELGTSGRYVGDFPSWAIPGIYSLVAYNRLGGSAADGDTYLGGEGNFRWPIGTLLPAELAQFFLTDSNVTYSDAIPGSVVREIADNATLGTDPVNDGLVLNLRADAGVFEDSAFTNPALIDGDFVGGWQDLSLVGNDATQADSGSRPTLENVTVHTTILTDSTARKLTLGDVASFFNTTSDIWSIFIMVRLTTSSLATQYIFSRDHNTKGRYIALGIKDLHIYTEIAGTGAYQGAVTLQPDINYILEWHRNGSTSFVQLVDGVPDAGLLNVVSPDPSTADVFVSGREYAGAFAGFNGHIGQVVGYNRLTSDLERTRIRQTMNSFWQPLDIQTREILDNIQTRLPAALVGGRMDSSVGAYQANLVPVLVTTIVDGYTVAQCFELWGAVLCGKTSNGPGNSVFRSMNDAADRVTSVANNNGDRTTVTLTP